jgi:hypothetical protein
MIGGKKASIYKNPNIGLKCKTSLIKRTSPNTLTTLKKRDPTKTCRKRNDRAPK